MNIPFPVVVGMSNVFLELWTNQDEDYARASKVIDSEVVNPKKKDL